METMRLFMGYLGSFLHLFWKKKRVLNRIERPDNIQEIPLD
jgi:hypothetical protein